MSPTYKQWIRQRHSRIALSREAMRDLRYSLQSSLAYLSSLFPVLRNSRAPVPIATPATNCGTFGREWAALVDRLASGQFELPRAASRNGLIGPFTTHGVCLEPVLTDAHRCWYDPRRPARDGDFVLVHMDTREMAALITEASGYPGWDELYGEPLRAGAPVVKWLRAADEDYWLLHNSGGHAIPLAANRILGVLAHVEEV